MTVDDYDKDSYENDKINNSNILGVVAHVCNLSTLGGRDCATALQPG